MSELEPTLLTTHHLSSLASALRQRRFPIVEHLRPGLTDAEMDELTAPLGLWLPTEARLWWGWHDGASAEGPSKIGANWWFAPLSACVDACLELREIAAADEFLGEDWWPSGWFPIALGDWALACDTVVAPGEPTPIKTWNLEDVVPSEPSLPSLGALIEMWTDVLLAGAWQYDAVKGTGLVYPEHLPDRDWPFGLP